MDIITYPFNVALVGIEPTMWDSESHALPLGYRAIFSVKSITKTIEKTRLIICMY